MMIKAVIISFYGFQKLVREKVIFTFIFIALVLILFTLVLGSISFDEQVRMIVHFGSAIQLFSLLGIALIYGASIIRREIEGQTILLTLARPLSRDIYFIGQWLSLVWVIALNWVILSFVILAMTAFSLPLVAYITAQFAIFCEVLIILSVTMMAALFTRPAISFFVGLGFYFIGQWTPDLIFFAQKSESDFFKVGARVVHLIFPQLYRFNLQSTTQILSENLQSTFFQVTIYTLGWTLFFIVCSLFAFRRKDLV